MLDAAITATLSLMLMVNLSHAGRDVLRLRGRSGGRAGHPSTEVRQQRIALQRGHRGR